MIRLTQWALMNPLHGHRSTQGRLLSGYGMVVVGRLVPCP